MKNSEKNFHFARNGKESEIECVEFLIISISEFKNMYKIVSAKYKIYNI